MKSFVCCVYSEFVQHLFYVTSHESLRLSRRLLYLELWVLEIQQWFTCVSRYRYVVFFLLGDSLASEFYVLTFQNTLSVPSS